MASSAPRLFSSLRSIMDPPGTPCDPSLVDDAVHLLDVLNKTSNTARLQRYMERRDERGYTLLHVAAEKNRPSALKCLLIKGGECLRARACVYLVRCTAYLHGTYDVALLLLLFCIIIMAVRRNVPHLILRVL